MEGRTDKAARNVAFAVGLKIYQIIVPFIMRTIMIYFLGIEYLGLNSLFTSILSVLNIAELGVGSAMVFHMYKPIAIKDDKKVCALINLYKQYYRVIGCVVLIFGILISPFLKFFIKSNIPSNLNIYILFYINLFATVLSYWLFAYKASILEANQRSDIKSKIMLIVNTIQYVIQAIALIYFKNYYFYLIIMLVSQVLNNLLYLYFSKRYYPEYKPIGKLENKERKEINQRVRDLFSVKVGAVILNSADSMVISTYMGLNVLAIYQNYFYIVSSLYGIIMIIFNSIMASVGNSIAIESNEKNYRDFNNISFIMNVFYGFIVSELLCLYQTFMKLWVGEALLLDFKFVVLFCMYFYIYVQVLLLCLYKDASGMWHSDRFRPLVTGLVNLIINIVLVHFIGLYGILISTIISLTFIGYPWLLKCVFSEIFKKKLMIEYLKRITLYTISTILIAAICCYLTKYIVLNNLAKFLITGASVFIIYFSLSYVFYKNTIEFTDSKKYFEKILKKYKLKGRK